MRPGELQLHIGKQTRSFWFDSTKRANLAAELGTTPLAYAQNADPELFCGYALFHSFAGKRSKNFTRLDVVKWFDEPIKYMGEDWEDGRFKNGQEVDKQDLTIIILYSHARSKTGVDATLEMERLEIMFGLDDVEDGEDGPLSDG